MPLKSLRYLLMTVCILFSSLLSPFGVGTVSGYADYTRQRLVADSMESLCEPVITGDFIQPWLCADWSPERWEAHMEMLTNAGVDLLIVQNCVSSYQGDDPASEGKYGYFYYPSAMANDPVYAVENSRVYADMLENCLSAAQKYGVQILIGLGGDTRWWSLGFLDADWRALETSFICRQADELYELYHDKYPDAFYGWYWFHEMYVAKFERYEKYWTLMLNDCLAHLTELDDSLPMLFSPFISAYENASVLRTLTCWGYLMEHTNFRAGDIFCPQDGFGTISKKTLPEVEQIAFAIRAACRLNPNVRFWFNVENFTTEGQSASIGRYVNQMDICSKFAERLISFSFSHYYSALGGKQAQYDDYLAYLAALRAE